jgi:hypothetical protein
LAHCAAFGLHALFQDVQIAKSLDVFVFCCWQVSRCGRLTIKQARRMGTITPLVAVDCFWGMGLLATCCAPPALGQRLWALILVVDLLHGV